MSTRSSKRTIPTAGDWYPPIFLTKEGKEITGWEEDAREKYEWFVTGTIYLRKNWVRVCFWGGDDHGIERDRHFQTEEQAEAFYERAVEWLSNVAIADEYMLRSVGFGIA